MDLDLTMPPARGKRPADVVFGYLRDLDATDVILLQAGVDMGSTTPNIQQIRQSHHQLAMLLANGVKPVEVSVMTGYSQSRISILKKDPAFAQLLKYYEGIREGVNVDVLERMKSIGLDALEIIQSRMDEKPDELPDGTLLKIAELTLDRAGFGPKSTVKHEHGLDEETLNRIKNTVDSERQGNVIEASDYNQPGVGDRDSEPARISQQETEALVITAEGNAVPAPSVEVPREEESGPSEVGTVVLLS